MLRIIMTNEKEIEKRIKTIKESIMEIRKDKKAMKELNNWIKQETS